MGVHAFARIIDPVSGQFVTDIIDVFPGRTDFPWTWIVLTLLVKMGFM